MKKFLATALTLVMIAGPVIDCVKAPPSVVTPAGKAAFSADQLVMAIAVLQDASITANNSGALSNADTALVQKFCRSAVLTIQASANGWQAAVGTALNQLRSNLSVDAQQRYGKYFTLIQNVLATL